MIEVNFYENVEDNLLKFAVIVSKHKGQWVFCKHRDRNTYECPGGRREVGEDISETAKRELYEETGAKEYSIEPVCVYSVKRDGTESFGMLFYADIFSFEELPAFEIECVDFFTQLPSEWTYPDIQPKLLEKVLKMT